MDRCQSPTETNHLVMVIHGVGDPAPGETLSLFARSVAASNQPLAERQDVVWLDEKSSSPDYVQRYATHIRQLDIGGQKATLAEVFWGDLSRVRTGILGVAIGLLEILFGLQYVAFASARQSGRSISALRGLGVLSAQILHGPTLAVTFLLSLLTLTLCGTEFLCKTHTHLPYQWHGAFVTQLLVIAVCAIATAFAAIGSCLTKHDVMQQFWNWVYITAAFISGLLLLKLFWLDSVAPEIVYLNDVHLGLLWYCRVLVWMLALLWLGEMIVVLAMAIAWSIGQLTSRTTRRSLHAAFLIPALVVGFWGLLLPTLWLSAARFLRRVVNLDNFDKLFEQAIPMLGVQVIMAGVIVITFGAVLLRFITWRSSILWKRSQMERGHEPPRLIVHMALNIASGVCLLIGVSLITFLSIQQMQDRDYSSYAIGVWLADANSWAVGLLAPLGLLLFMLFPHLRPILDILLDVVNHFYFRPTTVFDTIDEDEFDIREATFDHGKMYFARRDAIHARIKNSLAFFRDHLHGRPTLTLISHSQGTVIAIEVLNDPELTWLNSRFSEVRLVTMGSPFTHVYQYYFPHLYPSLDDPHWQELQNRLHRWINICRRDDFVGTRVAFPERLSKRGKEFSNHLVGARGHMNYWSDVEVLEILRSKLLDDGSAIWNQQRPIRRAA